MSTSIRLSIVIPVYQEAKSIRENLDTIAGHVRGLEVPFEFVIVDDGSTDGTWDCVQEFFDGGISGCGIRFSRNFGKEGAIRAGLENTKGGAVIVMDCDLQHPPELIPELYRAWDADGYEVVEAVKRKRSDRSYFYSVSAKLYATMARRLSGVDLRGASDYKLLDRRVVDVLIGLEERILFYRGLTGWIGYTHLAIPFDVPARQDGTGSRWRYLQLAWLAITSVTSFSSIPLRIVGLVGVFTMIAAVVFGIYTFIYWLSGHAVSGIPTVILLILIHMAIMSFALAIIGEYIAKIYEEIKRRPHYLTTERIHYGDSDSTEDSD